MVFHDNATIEGNFSHIHENYSVDLMWLSALEQDLVRGVFLLIFTIVGAGFNVFIIVAVTNRRIRNVRNILLIHLGAVGLATSMLTLLYAAVMSFSGYWVGGNVMCQLYSFLQTSFTQTTTWTIAAISWDKYQTIASPFHHSNTAPRKKMIILFVVFWISALVAALPPLFLDNGYSYHRILGSCFVGYVTSEGKRWYNILLLFMLFYLPLFVMLYSYAHIYRIARTQSSRIAATMMRMACVVQAPLALTTAQGPPQTFSSIKGTKAMLTILQLVGTFTLTYIPFSIVMLIGLCASISCVSPVLAVVVTTMFHAAPVTNGAIYGVRNKLLRNSFYRYIRRKIQHACYKDKRKNSIKRSSSFRMSLLQRKGQQNGGPGLRRTQSLQVKHMRTPSPNLLHCQTKDNIKKAHSFTLANGHTMALLDPKIVPTPNNEISNDSITPLELVADSAHDQHSLQN